MHILFSTPVIIFLLASVSYAESRSQSSERPRLEVGMSYADVLRHWGPASEKQEFESKREELWQYGAARIIFRNGRVLDWPGSESHENVSKLQTARSSAVEQTDSGQPTDDNLSSILAEIIGSNRGVEEEPKAKSGDLSSIFDRAASIRNEYPEPSPQEILEREMEHKAKREKKAKKELEQAKEREAKIAQIELGLDPTYTIENGEIVRRKNKEFFGGFPLPDIKNK